MVYDPARSATRPVARLFIGRAQPTELNRQGPDSGTAIARRIFPQKPASAPSRAAYIAQLRQGPRITGRRFVTKLETGRFFPAEGISPAFLRTGTVPPLHRTVGQTQGRRR